MEVTTMKKILENTESRRYNFREAYKEGERYYLNENDITNWNLNKAKVNKNGKTSEPLRKADNRIPSNFSQLLIDQEAGYIATDPPQIDVGEEERNEHIRECLGDMFAVRLNQLVVDASLSGKGWLHYWYDTDGSFQYGIVPPDQVTPIYTTDLNKKLSAVVREYNQLDTNTGDTYQVVEYWDENYCTVFKSSQSNYEDLNYYDVFNTVDISTGETDGTTSQYKHPFGAIPFIEFDKNKYQRPELYKYKGHIDIYDKIYNGFVNDLDDLEQSVITLKGYGGTNLQEFLDTLQKDKVVKLDEDGEVGQLNVNIPTEARDEALQIARDNIFIQGQGIDPKDFNAKSATSGTAIKMFYSHLELKASITQQYFSLAVSDLVRAILRHGNYPNANYININQTWNRAQINNSLEQAQTVATVAGFTSNKAKAKSNPLTSGDYQAELDEQQKEQSSDPYDNSSGGK